MNHIVASPRIPRAARAPWLLLAFVWLAAPAATAGSACTRTEAGPEAVATAAATAASVIGALERRDEPVALLAREGKDLSEYGLKYSHVGIVLRDHPDGRWSVLHELNLCGTARSGVFSEGLVNFFLDDLHSQDAKLVWLEPRVARSLLALLDAGAALRLHDARYNVIARWDSLDNQNSTGWALALLAAALADDARADRRGTLRHAMALGYRPDVIRIPYGQRLAGGLFSANARFTDHSLGDRLDGRYEVVTVRSIFDFLRRNRAVSDDQRLPADTTAAE